MADNKPEIDHETFDQINQAWQASKQMPPDKQAWVQDKLKKIMANELKTQDAPMDANGPLDTLGHAALKAMDYGSGLVRTGVGAAAAGLSGKPQVAMDLIKSNNPFNTTPAPSGPEILEKLGVPQGGRASDILPYAKQGSEHPWYQPEVGGALDPTARGAAGTAFDLLASPSGIGVAKNLVTGGEKAVYKGLTAAQIQAIEAEAKRASLEKMSLMDKIKSGLGNSLEFASDPINVAADKGGESLYRSAFSEADRAAKAAGARPVSDVMLRNNVWGTSKSINDQASILRQQLGEEVGNDVSRASLKDPLATVSTQKYIMDPIKRDLQNASQIGGQTQGANTALTRIQNEMSQAYSGRDVLDINDLQNLKKSMQSKAAAQSAYTEQPFKPGRGVNAGDNAMAANQMGDAYSGVGYQARRGVEDLADRVEPGLGGKFYLKNSDLSSLISSKKALEKGASSDVVDSLKAMAPASLAGAIIGGTPAYMGGHDPLLGALGGAALGLTTTSPFKTGAGLLLNKTAPYAGSLGRVYLNEKYGQPYRNRTPWDLLTDERNKK